MKIYIIGPTGSGKSTLGKSLSKKHNTKCYELDLFVYDDENNHVKRTDEERNKMLNNMLKKKTWIAEDVGRSKFEIIKEQADIIYYINIPHIIVYKRVITRWIKQRLGKERYNYPPTMFQLYDMLRITRGYFKKEPSKLESLKKYQNKIIYLNYKELNKLEN